MTDLDYQNHAERALNAVEMACDRINDETDADIDNQRTGGMITLTFSNQPDHHQPAKAFAGNLDGGEVRRVSLQVRQQSLDQYQRRQRFF